MKRSDHVTLAFCGTAILFAAFAVAQPAIPDAIDAIRTSQFSLSLDKARPFPDKFGLLDYALRNVRVEGLYCEFGVYKGQTANYIAGRIGDRELHGFDSFEGLPEQWWGPFKKGTFKIDGLPAVQKNVILWKGWFSQSLPKWSAEHRGPIAFAHMDADLYSSTTDVFRAVGDRFVPGTVISFDELVGYPGWQHGEYKAMRELISARGLRFEYLGYVPNNQQVTIRIM